MKKQVLKTVFQDTVPVMTGYLFLGIGFGIIMYNNGYSAGWSFCMALFMYAGSAQYLVADLLVTRTPLISVAVSTLLLNARHLFYGISMLDRYKNAGKEKNYLIFSLTDETYSLVTQNQPPEGISRHRYCLLVSLLDHIYWIVGCTLGGLIATSLPVSFEGIDFVLTALFVSIFVEQWLSTKHHLPAIIGAASTVLCLIIFGKGVFLIPSMALIAVLLTVSKKTGRRAAE